MKLKPFIVAFTLVAAFLFAPPAARIAQASCSLPYPVTPATGTNSDPNAVWSNFNALSACITASAVNSVSAGSSGNVTSSPTTGSVIVDVVANPHFTGTVSSSSTTPFAATAVGANTFQSDTTGSGTAFIFQANGSMPTGDLADFDLGNVTEAYIGNGGAGHFSGAVTASQFNGSGAGLTSGTIPDASLVTAPVTSVTASGNLSSSGGTTPALTMTATPSFTSVTATGLTPGDCVQAGTGGLLTTIASACGGGGGAVSSVSAGTSGNITSSPTTGAVVVDIVSDPTFTGGASLGGGGSALTLTGTGVNGIISDTSGSASAFVLNDSGGSSGDLLDAQLSGATRASILNGGGFSTTAATGLTLAGTGANTIASDTTGTATAFVLNAAGGSPTGHLQDWNLGGTTKASILNSGGGSLAGLTLTTITGSTQCLQVNSSGVVSGTGSGCAASGSYVQLSPGTAQTGSISVTSTIAGSEFLGSGAGLSSGTVPDAALVTAPVTSVTASGNLSSSGGTTPAITETGTPSFTSVTTTNGTSGVAYILSSSTTSGHTSITAVGDNVAGVLGNALEFGNYGVGPLVTFDTSGDEGIAASYYSASQRSLKNNIIPLSPAEAAKVVDQTKIVRFCYKTEHCKPGQTKHIGFIADDTSTAIAPNHKGMDVNATAALDLEVLQQTRREVRRLQAEVNALKAHRR